MDPLCDPYVVPELAILLFVTRQEVGRRPACAVIVAVLPKPAVFHIRGNGAYEPFVIPSELGQAINVERAEHNGRNQNDRYRGHRIFVNKARMLNAELFIVDIGVTHFKGSTDLF